LARSRNRTRREAKSNVEARTVQISLSAERITSFVREHGLLIRSGAIFLAAIGIFISVLALSVDAINATLAVAMAHLSNLVLRLLGAGTTVEGVIVRSSRFAVQIVAGCTGLQTMVIFIAAVLAYPSRPGQKLRGILLGVSIIFLLNLIRVVTLFYIGMLAPQYFEMAHLLVWQYLIVASTAIIMLAWVRRVNAAIVPGVR
jgi:exosortase/archaeosortase family protein